ncbi:hypothetical protein [Rhizorhabdus phycosphaerae]|uniref:hypothetical protein n=1 Tax=Rhizorhabdus phycosphaerae TaxID=2711156 RepID=UPI0013EC1F9E|nr:hypothetical protein [Rhizorhabdus phycosphaerae]
MIVLQSWAAVEAALKTPLDAGLKSILRDRNAQLSGYDGIATFVIIEPEDDPGQIEPPPLINLVDGFRFGDSGFTPSWEHIQDHGGWFELTYVLSDDGFGHIVLVPDAEGIDANLLKLCRNYVAEG